jgi:hypothetical protein
MFGNEVFSFNVLLAIDLWEGEGTEDRFEDSLSLSAFSSF